MTWLVLFHDQFELEFDNFPKIVQKQMLAKIKEQRFYKQLIQKADFRYEQHFKNF
jgi:hypothetical protein